MKQNINFLFLISCFILYTYAPAHTLTTSSYTVETQPEIIASILQKEKNIRNLKIIKNILNQLDESYGHLSSNLLKGQKLTIFFDPAHGKLNDGRWEGEATGRISCAGLPEELYSIMISRELYKLLSANKFLKIKSTNDFILVMKGKSNIYKNIPFSKTIEMAYRENAFIIISEHLNNISSLYKASGIVDIPGIHITQDENGYKYLTYRKGSHNGFLTLYNKYDVTGFSKNYASQLKERLVAYGMRPNNWEFGTVADDRFTYFVNFPISVIFECGFISNPKEERLLKNPEFQRKLAESQHEAFLESIKNIFGIDISGNEVKTTKDFSSERITLLKLSRIAIFYIQNCNAKKAKTTIDIMKRKYGSAKYKDLISPYKKIQNRLTKAERYYHKGKRLIKSKKKRGARYLKKARNLVKGNPIYLSFYNKYTRILEKRLGIRYRTNTRKKKMTNIKTYLKVKRAKRTTPIILAIEDNQSLKGAILKALSPTIKKEKKLLKSFKNAYNKKRIKVRRYSRKKKRNIYYWKWRRKKVKFSKGIYIVKLKNNLVVKSVKRVGQVALNPLKYQNQQYLKNSYFAPQKKHKSI